MNSLKLSTYFFEKIVIKLPIFPGTKGVYEVYENWENRVTVYHSKSDLDKFAVRMELSLQPRRRKTDKPTIFFEASIVGVFKRLDRAKTIRFLSKKLAPDILYDILLKHSSKIFDRSIATGFQMPPKLLQRSTGRIK